MTEKEQIVYKFKTIVVQREPPTDFSPYWWFAVAELDSRFALDQEPPFQLNDQVEITIRKVPR